VVVWSVTVIARLSSNASYEPAPTLTQFGLLPRLMQAFYVYAYYAWRPLVPWGLSPVYTRLIHFSPLEPIFLVSAILVLGLSILALRVVRRLPALSVLWAAHLLLIAPMLGLLEKPHYTSDRYAYAQGVLWAVGVAALLSVALRFSRPGALAAYAVLTCVCLYLGVLGVRQSRIWRDSVTLFKYTINSIQDDPLRSDLHSRLGLAYLVRGQSDDLAEAVIELTKYPAPSEAMLTAGWILLDHKRPEAAAALLQKALDAPADPLLVSRLRNALGVALSRTNNFPAAEAELMESVRLDPSYLEARSNLGQCLMAEGKHDLAIEQFRTLVQLSNGNPNSLRLLNEAIARARGAG
jgi:tetratricopeptide (TPR) repeat protein